MERVIKFRGKRPVVRDEEPWVYGSLSIDKDVYYILCDKTSHWGMVCPETVGQFTGKLAEGDIEIYEGDKVYDGAACFYNVDFDKDNCSFYLSFDNGMGSERLDEYNNGVLKITGNIHDK